MNKPKYIICHHTAAETSKFPEQFHAVNQWHKERWNGKTRSEMGFWGGYQYLIERDGIVGMYRGENEVGAHCKEKNMNYKSIGICLAGNFDVETPSKEQYMQLYNLIKRLQDKYNIPDDRVVPHRYFKFTDCWGLKLPNNVIGHLRLQVDDSFKVPTWAIESSKWAEEEGLITKILGEPVDDYRLAEILYRFHKKYIK